MEERMAQTSIMKIDQVATIDRGGGVKTWPLVVRTRLDGAKFTTGISVYPVGKGAPMHWHNCAEQVTLLEGRGEVEVDGQVTPLVPYDSTYIPAERMHCFRNIGDTPMRILWIYDSNVVTRTFQGSTEAVEHLSAADLMVAESSGS
jgi:mannose-6-phosphate isomerase-like protein (cupin superfamily)